LGSCQPLAAIDLRSKISDEKYPSAFLTQTKILGSLGIIIDTSEQTDEKKIKTQIKTRTDK